MDGVAAWEYERLLTVVGEAMCLLEDKAEQFVVCATYLLKFTVFSLFFDFNILILYVFVVFFYPLNWATWTPSFVNISSL